uniref:GAF domain-containing protein n=1 Tax=Haptolina brevifila TaxID=156173 RepID=A0A7S2MT92_9EUKA
MINIPKGAMRDKRLSVRVDAVCGSQTVKPESVLCIPFRSTDGTRPLGVCSVFNKRSANGGIAPFDELDEVALRPLLRSAALAVETWHARRQLYEESKDTNVPASTDA